MTSLYQIELTARYRKSYKKMAKRGLNMTILDRIVRELSLGNVLAPKFKDHALKGKYNGYRECHIKPDWLLIYKIYEDRLILVLVETGTHADLLGM